MKKYLHAFSEKNLKSLLGEKEAKVKIPYSASAFFSAGYFSSLRSVKQSPKSDRKGPAAGRSVLVVAPSSREAENLASEAAMFIDQQSVAFFPSYDTIPYEFSGIPADIIHGRLKVLNRLFSGESLLVFTSPEAIIRKFAGKENLRNISVHIHAGEDFGQETFIKKLFFMGYERTDRVDVPGDFCIKGSIVDVYPLNDVRPIRVDFFGDTVDSIRIFDVDSQASRDRREDSLILPSGELIVSGKEIDKLKKIVDERYSKNLAKPVWWEEFYDKYGLTGEGSMSQLHHPGIDELFPLVSPIFSFVDHFPEKPAAIFLDYEKIKSRIEHIVKEYAALYEQEKEGRICLPPETFLFNPLGAGEFDSVLRVSEWVEDDSEKINIFEMPLKKAEGFAGRSREIRKGVSDLVEKGSKICISSPYDAQLKRIAGIFKDEKFSIQMFSSADSVSPPVFDGKSSIFLISSNLREGFVVPDQNLYIWTDADIFGRSYRRRNRFKASTSSAIESFLDLKVKDYVVHVHHGVGRFIGLERVQAAGRERDFLVLEYADEDRLYVPLDQISLVQKYISSTESPSLDSLGKASFKKVRERVQKKVEEFAEELMRLYAIRMSQKGFAYPPDTIWQEEFEADFPFDETPDQISAIEAMKQDMESETPMDRLICGDVGYGKTEVAIRGAFKAVMAGRQVALICPTTILALQHFKSFTERFKNYPIRVDWISRFRTRGEISAIKKELLKGEIDIIIGTHAILSRDVHIKNLGLLVVDEEQRFGVVHKESIKKMRKLIDVLTLSATPIPRTLHMSLVGIRDLSVIQTPPRDRLPVRTYVMEDSDAILIEGITREISRGGQIFYLHNRIESIEAAAVRIRNLMPGITVAVLHGRMHEDDIEDILMDFMEQRFDILVTTAIIESGIDMPNVNTLMIDRADTFGLSQLYQIRGRVGRSNRQAYAYLFYPDGRSLSELAQKRLNTIMEYQELGSGFKVAMRDLEIRGAGNVLGREQSGDIIEVGYELYVKLLEEAVKKLKGEDIEPDIRCFINLKTDFYIPDDYITDVRQRIEFYKRLESAGTDSEVENIASEMQDRFGDMPESAVTFIRVEKIRALASIAGFESVYQEDAGIIQFKAGDYFRVPPEHLIAVLNKNMGLYITAGKKDTLFCKHKSSMTGEGLENIIQILKILVEPVLKKRKEKNISD